MSTAQNQPETNERVPDDLKGHEKIACEIAGVDWSNPEARCVLWSDLDNWDYETPKDAKTAYAQAPNITKLQLLRQIKIFLKDRGNGKEFSSPVYDLLAGGLKKKSADAAISNYKARGFHFNQWKNPGGSRHFREFIKKNELFLDGNVVNDKLWFFSENSQATPPSLHNEEIIMPVTDDGFSKPSSLNTIYYGPPGTGKTWTVKNILDKNFADRYEVVTFHQSYSYEDFVEGIRPVLNSDIVKYELHSGIFKSLCNKAAGDPDKQYALLIDEINRGNISKIFGELISLIEENKRVRLRKTESSNMPVSDKSVKNACTSESMTVTLPYSGEKFSVPHNLYIFGTMNTSDRSLALLDTALRRRFSFVAVYPNSSPLKENTIDGVNLMLLLDAMNRRITQLYDKEHCIGHAYFFGVKDIASLAQTFKNKIIPLLEEYFFEDQEKISHVLGGASFYKTTKCTDPYLKKIYDEGSLSQLPEQWALCESKLNNPEAYKHIYE